jgi:hypothetical protein
MSVLVQKRLVSNGNDFCCRFQRVMKAEDKNNRSKAMSMVSVDMLCTLLKFVIQRMKYPDVSFLRLVSEIFF